MVDEAEGDELHQFQEVNIFVDTILECVYDHAEQDRKIIFSSFHPEICLALNLKQPNYPVFFLTDAGTLPMADIRCNSLQGAMRFAKQADLLGIVSASEPVLQAPRMVRVIKESGLLLFTYGVLNNEVENAIAQKKYGVDAVIVVSVFYKHVFGIREYSVNYIRLSGFCLGGAQRLAWRYHATIKRLNHSIEFKIGCNKTSGEKLQYLITLQIQNVLLNISSF